MTKVNLKFALNYSYQAESLVRNCRLEVDCFKCPPWPEAVTRARRVAPTYVHFSFNVGAGIGDALDAETGRAPDWYRVEELIAATGTPLVNLHLGPGNEHHPNIPSDATDPRHMDTVVECMVKDVQAVIARFGRESVVVENLPPGGASWLDLSIQPEVVRRVVEETGCGLLLDITHARWAASYLGMDVATYIEALPIERTREVHVTGLQPFGKYWVDLARAAKVSRDTIEALEGQMTDHLPMTEEDWKLSAYAMEQIRGGAWGDPWAVAFEYGGVGPLWEAITEAEVLLTQVPRLHEIFQNGYRR